MCQSVNLLGKKALGYVFPNFFADTKIIPLQFCSSFNPDIFRKTIFLSLNRKEFAHSSPLFTLTLNFIQLTFNFIVRVNNAFP